MAVLRSMEEAADYIRSFVREYPRSVAVEFEELAQAVVEAADDLVRGELTAEDLRAFGHPYARRHGAGYMEPLPINDPNSTLRGHFRKFRRVKGDTVYFQIFSIAHSRSAIVLRPQTDASAMIDRGFYGALAAKAEELAPFYVRRAR
jgi:hypothetical protein